MRKYFKNNFYAVKKILTISPLYFVFMVIDAMMEIFVPGIISVYFTKEFLGTVETMVKAGDLDYMKLIILFCILIGLMLTKDIWSFISGNIYTPIAVSKFNEKMTEEIYAKAVSLDMSCYDSPEFYEEYTWALTYGANVCIEIVKNLIQTVVCILTVFTVLGIVLSMDMVSLLILIVYVGITFIFSLRRINRIYENTEEEENRIEMRLGYDNQIFFLENAAKELRLTRLGDFMLARFEKDMEQSTKVYMGKVKDVFKLTIVETVVKRVLWDILFTLMLIYRIVVAKTLTIGGMITVQNVANQVVQKLEQVVQCFGLFKEKALYLDKYIKFLGRESLIRELPDAHEAIEPFSSLELRNISFKYSGSETYALRNINMKINRNEKIAIVGYNGAGKSTLVKLILRLYQQDTGKIFYNQINTEHITTESYRKKFGIAFQDSQLFAVSVAENVSMAPFSAAEAQTVLHALEQVGFTKKLKTLPKGINSVISKEFDPDGIILSGGERQKLVLARIFAHDRDILILDEPSSALDPDSEYELTQLVMSAAQKKTVIMISHRLSSTINADRIYMMANGEIVESGTHKELMALDGKYAEMFKAQAANYITL